MSRRTTLPGADELFRVTTPRPGSAPESPLLPAAKPAAAPASAALLLTPTPSENDAEPEVQASSVATLPAPDRRDSARHDPELQDSAEDHEDLEPPASRRRVAVSRRASKGQGGVDRRSSGRERHEEKITVYVSPEELFDLEHARLVLRGEHGIAIDRGRIVREAIAVVMADFDAKGAQSILVRRLGAL